MNHLLVVAGVVLGVNLLPAFAPPTWAVLVYFRITFGLPIFAIALVGALSAAAGRTVLARSFRFLGTRLPQRRRENLEALGTTLSSSRGLLGSLLLFAASPIPSNTLFEAAGLAQARLGPLVAAFCAGRLVSYSVSLAVASHVAGSLHDIITGGFNSPGAIAGGLAGVAGLVIMVRVDWNDVIDHARVWLADRTTHRPRC